ncbi:hypothetical protein ACLIL1_015385, partial [Acinetobacter radioresistens]|uniref:hypothetical protein n=1 Tax=Acinetobacter radioresistens TaxID=40216 RepID=UPI0039851932
IGLFYFLYFPFLSFKKLLKAFRPPSSPYLARLSDFKKVLLPDNQVLLPDKTHLKKYFYRT